MAAFGLTFVTNALIGQQLWLRLGGGAFLCYLGVKTFLSAPAERPAAARGDGLLAAYASTLVLTLTNPTTILSFVAIFAGLGAGMTGGGYGSAAILVAGVFAGSALWWLLLSGGVGVVRGRLDRRRLQWVNRLSGLVIGAFGVLAFLSVWR